MRNRFFKNFKLRVHSNVPDGDFGGGGSAPSQPSEALTIDALEQFLSGADEGGSTPPASPPDPTSGNSPDVPGDANEPGAGDLGTTPPTVSPVDPATGLAPTQPAATPGVPGTLPGSEGDGAPGSTPPAPTPQEAELALLKTQVEQYQTMLQTMQQGQGQGQPGQPTPGATDPAAGSDEAGATPEYAFNIPDQLMTALDSEDPAQRRVGIGALAQGVARTVHETIMGQVQSAFTALPTMINEVVSAGTQAQQTTADFYGKYPELDKPGLHELVKSVGAQVLNETKATAWSPQLRDVIAQRTFAVLKSVGGQAPSTVIPPATPPNMMNGGSGGGNTPRGGNVPDIADEIASLANY